MRTHRENSVPETDVTLEVQHTNHHFTCTTRNNALISHNLPRSAGSTSCQSKLSQQITYSQDNNLTALMH